MRFTDEFEILGAKEDFTEEVTFTNATNVVDSTGTDFVNDDRVDFTQAGGALPTGISADINYYVIEQATNTFQVSLTSGGSAVTFSDDGSGTIDASKPYSGNAMNVADYEEVVMTIDTSGSTEVLLKIVGCISDDTPTWINSQSVTNRYEYLDVVTMEDSASIDGDTGFTLAGTDVHHMVRINVRGLNYINVELSGFNVGAITVKAKAYTVN